MRSLILFVFVILTARIALAAPPTPGTQTLRSESGQVNIETGSAKDIQFSTNNTLRMSINGTTGALSGVLLGSDATFTSLTGTATSSLISTNTADAADNKSITIAGGGAYASGRGAGIVANGNDVATVGGQLSLTSDAGGTGGTIVRGAWSGGSVLPFWSVIFDGRLVQDATNGGRLRMARSGTATNLGIELGTNAVTSDVGNFHFVINNTTNSDDIGILRSTADAAGSTLVFFKSRKTDGTADTIVANGDSIGRINFLGANGTAFDNAARIEVTVDGTPGASADMPGNMVFYTTPDGSATTEAKLRIARDGVITLFTASDLNFAVGKATIGFQEAVAGTACSGTLTANGATPVVTSTTCAITGARIFLQRTSAETGTVNAWVSAISTGVSFSITSEAADSGTYNWVIFHEAP